MLFCGLEGGQEEQEGDSPSYFNRYESSTVAVLIQDLIDSMKGGAYQAPAISKHVQACRLDNAEAKVARFGMVEVL